MLSKKILGFLQITFFIDCFSWLLIILSPITFYAPSIYHVYVPRFKRLITKQDKDDKSREEEVKISNEGNLRGVTSKLDYIKSLNVDYLYLSPFFESPKMDGGYDVSDYQKVDPYYGSNQDFQDLLNKSKQKKLKVMVDLVLNHTSFKHDFFKKALAGLKKGDNQNQKFVPYYYFFKSTEKNNSSTSNPPKVKLLFDFDDHKKGDIINLPFWNDAGLNESKKHPYTFLSNEDLNSKEVLKKISEKSRGVKKKGNEEFYQPWERDDKNDEGGFYYLYTFSWFQPDLNWNNPKVREEMEKIANYWISQGVKGFRFDAIPIIAKALNSSLTLPSSKKLKKFLKEIKSKTFSKEKDFVTIGELSQSDDSNSDTLTKIAKQIFTTAYLPLNNLYFNVNGFPRAVYNIRDVRTKPHFRNNFNVFTGQEYKNNLLNTEKFKTSLIMENHDHIRSVSRYIGNFKKDDDVIGDDWKLGRWPWAEPNFDDRIHNTQNYLKFAKVLSLFKFFQSGIPLIYNGQEIGMVNDFTGANFADDIINKSGKYFFLKSVDLQSKIAIEKHLLDDDYKNKNYILKRNFKQNLGRDSARTVFQWTKNVNSGFCKNCKLWNGETEITIEDQQGRNRLLKKKYLSEDYYSGKWKLDNNKKSFFFDNVLSQQDKQKIISDQYLNFKGNLDGFPVLNPIYKEINVENQEQDLNSPLKFYRQLLELRKTNKVLNRGEFKEFKEFKVNNFNNLGSQMVTAYTRTYGESKYLVIVNLDITSYQVKIELGKKLRKRILLNTHKEFFEKQYIENNHILKLKPYQGLVINYKGGR